MSHEHKLRDTDPYFRIDPDTRLITDLSDKGTTIVQNDHNSERFTFELPRFIDGHDMSLCNVIEVHYINIGSTERHSDVYEITEEDREIIKIANSTEEALLCTWLISQNATALSGTLSFVLRFMCTSTGESGESIVDYAWSTGIYTKIVITPGIFNSEIVVEQYADVLEEWRQELFSSASYSKAEIDDLLSNPTITENILLSKANTTCNREDDEYVIENDGVSTSTITFSNMFGSYFGQITFNISGYIKFTFTGPKGSTIGVDQDLFLLDVYPDGSFTFEGNVKSSIMFNGNFSNDINESMIVTDFKKITVIASELNKKANVDSVYTKSEVDSFITSAISNIVNDTESKISNNANAFVKTESGKAIRVEDVSPIKHKATVQLNSKNKFYTFCISPDYSTDSAYISQGGLDYVIITSPTENTYCSTQRTLGELCPGLKVGETYTLSGSTESTDAKYIYLAGNVKASWKYGFSKVVTEDMLNALVVLYGVSNTTCRIENIQLELGDKATEYERAVDFSSVGVSTYGKNLLDISKAKTIVVGASGSQRNGLIFSEIGTYTLSCSTSTGIAVKIVTNGVYGDYTTLLNDVVYTFTLASNQYLIIYQGAENVPLSHELNNPQIELGNTATEYEPYVNVVTYHPDGYGHLKIDSISPTMTVITDTRNVATDNVTMDLTYHRDSNKVVGDFETALDELHNYAQALITGGSE